MREGRRWEMGDRSSEVGTTRHALQTVDFWGRWRGERGGGLAQEEVDPFPGGGAGGGGGGGEGGGGLGKEEVDPFPGGGAVGGIAADQIVLAVELAHQARGSEAGDEVVFDEGAVGKRFQFHGVISGRWQVSSGQ